MNKKHIFIIQKFKNIIYSNKNNIKFLNKNII